MLFRSLRHGGEITADGGESGHLRHVGHVRGGVRLEVDGGLHDVLWADHPADAPTGHGIGLGDTVQHDDLIKRVIGLSGEMIEIRDCVVFIDGAALSEPWLDEISPDLSPSENCGTANLEPVAVGESQVFLIGDNRAMSFDSRMFGPIDRDLIRGKAMVVIWPFASITLL